MEVAALNIVSSPTRPHYAFKGLLVATRVKPLGLLLTLHDSCMQLYISKGFLVACLVIDSMEVQTALSVFLVVFTGLVAGDTPCTIGEKHPCHCKTDNLTLHIGTYFKYP